MRKIIIAAGGAVAAALTLGAGAASAATGPHFTTHRPENVRIEQRRAPSIVTAYDQNWSGYVKTGRPRTVQAQWKVPSVTCQGSKRTTVASAWVGLNGWGSGAVGRHVEQGGTDSFCYGGSAYYDAWFESVPAQPHSRTLSNIVSPGDTMVGYAHYSGGKYYVQLTDQTQGWTRHVTYRWNHVPGSCEVVLEAPAHSLNGKKLYPLAKFKTIRFTNVDANIDARWNLRVFIAGYTPANKDRVSALKSNAFTVTWVRN